MKLCDAKEGRRRLRGRSLVALATLVMALALLAGCGGGGGGTNDSAEGDTGSSSAEAGAETTTASASGSGGTLSVGMTAADLPLLDTFMSQSQGYEGIRWVGNMLYDGYTRFDLSDPEVVPPLVPSLAKSWKPNADLTKWTFELQPNVKFQDGTPWDADAAIFNLDRYTNPDFEYFSEELNGFAGQVIGGIESYRKVGPMSVEITTKAPQASLPGDLATFFQASPTAVEKEGNKGFASNPVGTGPFSFGSVDGNRLTLLRNEDYWRGPPKLEKLILTPMPDQTARVAALKTGEVNWIEAPSPDNIPPLEAEGFDIQTNSYDHIWLWVLDTTRPPFDKPEVRQAINYAIDREALAESLLAGTAEPIVQLVPKANFAHDPANDKYGYDPEKAEELLTEAGYPDGFSFKLVYPTSGSGNMYPTPMNEALQADLKKVGIEAELQPMEWAAMLVPFNAGQMPLNANAMNISLNFQQEGFWQNWLGAGSELNVGKYDNPKVQALLDEAQTIEDDEKRAAVYAEAAKIVTDDAAWLFVVSDLNARALAPTVKDFQEPKSWFVDINDVYVE